MAQPLITLESLSKTYNFGTPYEVEALSDVNLQVHEGEFVSIVGPSGCGKTTLLKIIGGLISPTEGGARIRGEIVTRPRPEVSIVFQESSLFSWRTAIRNVEFGLEINGVEKSERRRQAQEMIDLTGLSGFEDAYPHELSGGMKQRISLARTLATDPDILLMDEPFGSLDEQTRLLMGEELLRIWEETGKTVLFITHSLQESIILSDRVGVMSNRPGHIEDVVSIKLPRPRSTDMVVSDEFDQAYSRIWNIIRHESGRTLNRRT